MSSMKRVMEKIEESAGPIAPLEDVAPAPLDAEPHEPPVETESVDLHNPEPLDTFEPPETIEPSFSEQPAEETEPTAFVSAFSAAPATAEPPRTAPTLLLDERTASWDGQRVEPAIVAYHDRLSSVAEQYRSLRARLLAVNPARVPQVIAITSSVPEEGKSVTAINLGLTLAEGGEHSVLIVDADFRRSSIARMLDVDPSPGFAEVIRGEVRLADAVRPTPLANLRILTAGKVHNRGYGELLGGPAVASVLDEVRQSFGYTFIDTPPVTTVSDVCLLAPHADGALIVIEMRRTPEPTVQQTVRALAANNVKLLGAVLSRYREHSASYYERYYSSYYYGR